MTKILGYFSSYSRVRQTSRNNMLNCTKRCDDYWANYGNFSVTPWRLLKTHFSKKKAILPMKKTLAGLPLAISNITNVREQNITVQKVFWYLLCKVYFYFYRTYEVVTNKHFKKRQSSRWQRFWPNFAYIIEYEKPQVANDKRVEFILKLMCKLSVYCYRT